MVSDSAWFSQAFIPVPDLACFSRLSLARITATSSLQLGVFCFAKHRALANLGGAAGEIWIASRFSQQDLIRTLEGPQKDLRRTS